MTAVSDNPYSNSSAPLSRETSRVFNSRLTATLLALGIVTGLFGLVLISNRLGNTDALGLPTIGIAGWFLATGMFHRIMKLRFAILAGILFAPVAIVALFIVYWIGVILSVG